MRLVPLPSAVPCLRQRIPALSAGRWLLRQSFRQRACGVVPFSSSRPPRRARWRLPRSVGPCCVAVGPCYTPGAVCVNGRACYERPAPTPCPFWAWPITPVGQSTLTTLQTHVRVPNHGDSARGVPAVSVRWCPVRPPLAGVDDQSRPWGRAVPPFTMRGGYRTHRRVVSCHSSRYAAPHPACKLVLELTSRTQKGSLLLLRRCW